MRLEIGQRFGRLRVIENIGLRPYASDTSRRSFVRCRCDCGGMKECTVKSLKNSSCQSCGCFLNESRSSNGRARVVHGELKTPTWNSWMSMKRRVLGKDPSYTGVKMTMDSRWKIYENFREDMGYRPAGKTLDKDIKKPGNTHYCKELCMWATPKEQANCRRNSLSRR